MEINTRALIEELNSSAKASLTQFIGESNSSVTRALIAEEFTRLFEDKVGKGNVRAEVSPTIDRGTVTIDLYLTLPITPERVNIEL